MDCRQFNHFWFSCWTYQKSKCCLSEENKNTLFYIQILLLFHSCKLNANPIVVIYLKELAIFAKSAAITLVFVNFIQNYNIKSYAENTQSKIPYCLRIVAPSLIVAPYIFNQKI